MALSIHPIADLPQILRPPVRLAAMDLGSRTIGLALSTPDWQMTTPLTTIRRGKWHEDLKSLTKALSGYSIGALIVGLPLHMDDSEGSAAQSVRQTIHNLLATHPNWLGPPGIICFWDERVSTLAAQEIMFSHHTIKSAKTSGALDAMAAKIILDRAVDHLNNHIKKEA